MKSNIHIVRNCILFILSFSVGLLFIDRYERFAEIESLSNFEVDSIHVKRLLPDVPLLYLNEGFYLGQANHYGYLGPDYPPEKRKNTFRVALIGDSFVAAFQVFDRNSFRAVLEHQLNQIQDLKTEVLNFGWGGFVLSDMYVYYKTFASKFQPDKILVFVHNDDFYQHSSDDLLPTVKMHGDSLVIVKDFIKGSAFKKYNKSKFLRENCVFLKIANNCFKIYKDGLSGPIIFGKLNHLFTHIYEKNATLVSEESAAGEKVANEIPLLSKRIINTLARNNKIYLVLIDNPSAQIEQLIDSSGIQTIRIYLALNGLKEKGIDPNYWLATNKRGHWNNAAHKVIGEVLAKKLSGNE